MTMRESLLLMGVVGIDKTHIATALDVEACKRGHAIQFFRTFDLVSLLQEKYVAVMLNRLREKKNRYLPAEVYHGITVRVTWTIFAMPVPTTLYRIFVVERIHEALFSFKAQITSMQKWLLRH